MSFITVPWRKPRTKFNDCWREDVARPMVITISRASACCMAGGFLPRELACIESFLKMLLTSGSLTAMMHVSGRNVIVPGWVYELPSLAKV